MKNTGKPKVRHNPRMSVNALAEYLSASTPSARRRVVKEQKHPKPFMQVYYEVASRAIVDFLLDPSSGRDIAGGRQLRREELAFLLSVFEALEESNRLPFVSLMALGDVLHAAQKPPDDGSASAGRRLADDTLASLAARTSLIAQRMLDQLADSVPPIDIADARSMFIECYYDRAPELDVPSVLRDATSAAELPLALEPVRRSVRTGSYIEVIQATLVTAFAFQVLLFALNGVLIQLVEMKERLRVLRLRRPPKRFQLIARSEQQPLPAALRQPVRRLLDFAASGSWLHDPHLKGIGGDNLREVRIEPSTSGEHPTTQPSDTDKV